MEKKKEKIHMGRLILQKLKEQERSIAWLARQLSCDDANLGRVLRDSKYIHSELIYRISEVLKENLFAYYDAELNEL